MVGSDMNGLAGGHGISLVGGQTKQVAKSLTDGEHGVGLIKGLAVLSDACETFHGHASIDAAVLQGEARAVLLLIELGEDAVPEFEVAASGITVFGSRFLEGEAGAVLLAAIVVEFGAGPAGSGFSSGSPEIIFFLESNHTGFGQTNLFGPNIPGFIVVAEDGGIDSMRIKAGNLGGILPGPGEGLLFEVVAEGEVPQHFKESVMTDGAADVFQVAAFSSGAHALLDGSSSGVGKILESGIERFKLNHSSGGEEQGGVVGGDEGAAGHDGMVLFFEELTKAAANVGGTHMGYHLERRSECCQQGATEFFEEGRRFRVLEELGAIPEELC
jgi:hypothetical protein